ncbi:MAG: GWxTD domain-containing protein [bacterium]|nr:GWxTD domain-containing protein [bacterium]
MEKILKTSIIVCAVASVAFAEEDISPQGENILFSGKEFFADYVTFKGTNDKTYLEVYFGVSLKGLTATETDEGDIYRCSVGAQIKSIDGSETIDRDMAYKNAILPTGELRDAPLSVVMLTLSIPPGQYEIEMGVGDIISGESSLYSEAINIPDYSAGFSISGIELASAVAPSDEAGEFVKNGYRVVPNPTKLESDNPGETHIYYEIYNTDGTPEDITLEHILQQKNGKVMLKESERYPVKTDVARVKTFDLKGFPAGSYELIINITKDDGALTSKRKSFVIYHQTTAEEIASLKSKYLPYTKTEEDEIRRYLSYVASEKELDAFDAMPPEEKPMFVEYIWDKNDPYPETQENEFKDEFFRRFDYANQNFHTAFRDGTDTDRGRIYLRFGEPDDIIREPGGLPSQIDYDISSWQTEPFEVWEYFGTEEGKLVWFYFIDKNGDGSYWIESSSLPGYGTYEATDPSSDSGYNE